MKRRDKNYKGGGIGIIWLSLVLVVCSLSTLIAFSLRLPPFPTLSLWLYCVVVERRPNFKKILSKQINDQCLECLCNANFLPLMYSGNIGA